MKNSDKVRKAYERSGLTYAELSKLTGIKANSLACWITGRRNPPDYVANLIEEKVDTHINGGSEYINKKLCRDQFAEAVCKSDIAAGMAQKIIKVFDELPTISIKR